jgi:hypothetical protein
MEQVLKSTPGATKELVHELQEWHHPRYPEWNRHIGRECGPSPSAIVGGLKGNMLEVPQKQEMYNLLKHTMNHDQQVFEIYWQGLRRIREVTNVNLTETAWPTIRSTDRYVRNFIK